MRVILLLTAKAINFTVKEFTRISSQVKKSFFVCGFVIQDALIVGR